MFKMPFMLLIVFMRLLAFSKSNSFEIYIDFSLNEAGNGTSLLPFNDLSLAFEYFKNDSNVTNYSIYVQSNNTKT